MIEQLVIREAVPADLPAIVGMLSADAIREVAEDANAPGYLQAYEEIKASPRSLLLVGDLAGEIVATAQLDFIRHVIYNGGLIAQVESVRTLDRLRGKGIGTALMHWILDEARRRGADRVQLTSNRQRIDAHRFYERLGFVSSHVGMKRYLGEAT